MIVNSKAVKQFQVLCRWFAYRSQNALDRRGSGSPLAPRAKGPTPYVPYQITSYPKNQFRQQPEYVQAKEVYEDIGRLTTPQMVRLREREIDAKWRERIVAAHQRINALLCNKKNATIGEVKKIQPMTAAPSNNRKKRKPVL